MADFNETTVAQSFVNSSRPLGTQNREQDPKKCAEELYFRRRRSPLDAHSLSPRSGIVHARLPAMHTPSDSHASPERRNARFEDVGRRCDGSSDERFRDRRIVRQYRNDDRDVNIDSLNHVRERYSRGVSIKERDACDYASDSDNDEYPSTDGDHRKHEKLRNKRLLYVGLACITTLAAGNNVYQSTKAYHARRQHIDEGGVSGAEAMRLRKKALMLDVISVGVVAVGINNVRLGWKRVENLG